MAPPFWEYLAGNAGNPGMAGYWHQSVFWSDLGPEVGYEGIGIVDSSLPAVGVLAKAATKDTPRLWRGLEIDVVCLREQWFACFFFPLTANTSSLDYGKGTIFYLRDNIVLGIILWKYLIEIMHF
ncbi:apoptosis-inducing factor 1, mitochondrial-like [Eriocheir sinensis]|uniref:apoptosis-inducing factor 1, mitochondrial-like n=1 Tax=Eriocheir sinensis TaxID=95602 RepID=UPI0021C5B61E|nr:apoptosis-inducing factor 1, mitochondrial-like [Eriocheir sinensis]